MEPWSNFGRVFRCVSATYPESIQTVWAVGIYLCVVISHHIGLDSRVLNMAVRHKSGYEKNSPIILSI